MAQMSHQLKRGTVSSSLKREPYCTVGYRCQPLLSGADWQRVQMARKSSQISKWSLQGWRFLPRSHPHRWDGVWATGPCRPTHSKRRHAESWRHHRNKKNKAAKDNRQKKRKMRDWCHTLGHNDWNICFHLIYDCSRQHKATPPLL